MPRRPRPLAAEERNRNKHKFGGSSIRFPREYDEIFGDCSTVIVIPDVENRTITLRPAGTCKVVVV